MNNYPKILNVIIFITALTAPLEILAQRVTPEDVYGESTGGSNSDFITGIVLVAFIGFLFYGMISSKGVRKALGSYALMLAGAIGIPGLIFAIFGENAAIFSCIILIACLYFYDNNNNSKRSDIIRPAATNSRLIRKSRSEFSSDLEYFRHASTFSPIGKYHFYKFKNGIGIKETGQIYKISELEAVDGQYTGYWIDLNNEIDRGCFFISNHNIEIIGIDYKNNKFLSRCPYCNQMCRGAVYLEVTIQCPKCSLYWTQRVE
jgi:hypothetical protein